MDYSSHARWMTPDPLGGDVMNPQSYNRYARVYPEQGRRVDNNPATLTDPLGLSHPTACWTFPGTGWGILPGCEIAYGGGGGLSGGNPADPCSKTSYAISNAECGGPAGLPSLTPWGDFPLPPFGGMGRVITIDGASSPGQPPMIEGAAATLNAWSCGFPYSPVLCQLSPDYLTGQVGISGSWTFPWGMNVNFSFGIAVDLHGHVAVYHTLGGGAAAGAGGSVRAGEKHHHFCRFDEHR